MAFETLSQYLFIHLAHAGLRYLFDEYDVVRHPPRGELIPDEVQHLGFVELSLGIGIGNHAV